MGIYDIYQKGGNKDRFLVGGIDWHAVTTMGAVCGRSIAIGRESARLGSLYAVSLDGPADNELYMATVKVGRNLSIYVDLDSVEIFPAQPRYKEGDWEMVADPDGQARAFSLTVRIPTADLATKESEIIAGEALVKVLTAFVWQPFDPDDFEYQSG